VSIKTINFRDAGSGRYTKNYTRADAELRAEASDYHDRQPYAVMIAVVFMPVDACDDGSSKTPSSFGGAVQTFRFRAGRDAPMAPSPLFERVFIGLYGLGQERFGEVVFFDVMNAPPRRGRPAQATLLDFAQLIDEIVRTYDRRNHPQFEWADEGVEPATPPSAFEEIEASEDEDDEGD
jgi:hypothetical protein